MSDEAAYLRIGIRVPGSAIMTPRCNSRVASGARRQKCPHGQFYWEACANRIDSISHGSFFNDRQAEGRITAGLTSRRTNDRIT